MDILFLSRCSFWWNDEGETQFETYHTWNVAHQLALTAHDP